MGFGRSDSNFEKKNSFAFVLNLFTSAPGLLCEKYQLNMVEISTWLILALSPVVAIGVVILIASIYFRSKRPSKFTVAFFHPYWYVNGKITFMFDIYGLEDVLTEAG